MKPRLLVPLILASPGCHLPFSAVDDALRESGVRTAMVENGFTLYSPYEAARTAELSRVVAESLEAVRATFEVGFRQAVQVIAIPLDVQGFGTSFEADVLRFEGAPAPPTLHEVAGFTAPEARGAPTLAFFVARDRRVTLDDGREILETFRFDYAGIIRHELAHLCAKELGLDGPTWFSEGLALEVEYSVPEGGRLVPDALPPTLGFAARVHTTIPLERILDWRENGDAIARGEEEPFREGRPLAHAYMRFLLDGMGGSRSPAAFREILDRSRAEHLAAEEAWQRWLDGLPLEPPDR